MVTLALASCGKRVPLQLGQASNRNLMAAMTTDEKINLLVGTGLTDPAAPDTLTAAGMDIIAGSAGTTMPLARMGIPSIVLADATAGLHLAPTRPGSTDTYYTTAFPVGTALASTWDVDLVQRVGAALGKEALEYGVDVLLAPSMNIQRNPLCAQNAQSYAEDPLLAGHMAAATVRGVQSQGVAATLRLLPVAGGCPHNDLHDTRLTPRALREIYLKAFEIALRQSQPRMVMTTAGAVNGTQASESSGLLRTVLRNEWGFKGAVVTQWFAGLNAVAQVKAGNDLLMPGTQQQVDHITAAVTEGKIKPTELNRNVENLLNLVQHTPRFKQYAYTNRPPLQQHAEVARQAAADGMVLLKNTNHALPLKPGLTIALHSTSPHGLMAAAPDFEPVHAAYTVPLAQGLQHAGYEPLPLVQPTQAAIGAGARTAHAAVVVIDRCYGATAQHISPRDFELTPDENALLRRVSAAYGPAGKPVIVVLHVDGVIETESWKHLPDAILLAWHPGQEAGHAVADVLSGRTNPSGRLTVTLPVKCTDVPSAAALADASASAEANHTVYEEDIFVGYRYFDTFRRPCSYPFGHGLGYTEFTYENAALTDENGQYTVTLTVTNTGACAGREVVQLYVSSPMNTDLSKPLKELKAFAKTRELKPGESQTLTLTVMHNDIASYHDGKGLWETAYGSYKFLLAASAQDVKLMLTADVNETHQRPANAVLLPKGEIGVIRN